MNRFIQEPENQVQIDGSSRALQATSLLYFKEALSKEAYEQCAEILKQARQAGVSKDEIQKLITEHMVYLKVRDRKLMFKRGRP
jgi:DNA-binding transcriptional regulator YhcF (GntR family)